MVPTEPRRHFNAQTKHTEISGMNHLQKKKSPADTYRVQWDESSGLNNKHIKYPKSTTIGILGHLVITPGAVAPSTGGSLGSAAHAQRRRLRSKEPFAGENVASLDLAVWRSSNNQMTWFSPGLFMALFGDHVPGSSCLGVLARLHYIHLYPT